MDHRNICEQITALIGPITEFNGAEIVRIKLTGQAHKPTLQIMAERPDFTMDLGLCETLSREYSLLLDVNDIIASEYTLEVSSPGIDRPLTRQKDFIRWSGFEAKIELREKQDDRKRFKGILQDPTTIAAEQDEQNMTINLLQEDQLYSFPFSSVDNAQLTLSDALLEATKNGVALHGLDCDIEVPDTPQETLELEIDPHSSGKKLTNKR